MDCQINQCSSYITRRAKITIKSHEKKNSAAVNKTPSSKRTRERKKDTQLLFSPLTVFKSPIRRTSTNTRSPMVAIMNAGIERMKPKNPIGKTRDVPTIPKNQSNEKNLKHFLNSFDSHFVDFQNNVNSTKAAPPLSFKDPPRPNMKENDSDHDKNMTTDKSLSNGDKSAFQFDSERQFEDSKLGIVDFAQDCANIEDHSEPEEIIETATMQEKNNEIENSLFFTRYMNNNTVSNNNAKTPPTIDIPSPLCNESVEPRSYNLSRPSTPSYPALDQDRRIYNFDDQIPFAYVGMRGQDHKTGLTLIPVYRDNINKFESNTKNKFDYNLDILLPSKLSYLSLKGGNSKSGFDKTKTSVNVFKKKAGNKAKNTRANGKNLKIKMKCMNKSDKSKSTDLNKSINSDSDFEDSEEQVKMKLKELSQLNRKSQNENSKQLMRPLGNVQAVFQNDQSKNEFIGWTSQASCRSTAIPTPVKSSGPTKKRIAKNSQNYNQNKKRPTLTQQKL